MVADRETGRLWTALQGIVGKVEGVGKVGQYDSITDPSLRQFMRQFEYQVIIARKKYWKESAFLLPAVIAPNLHISIEETRRQLNDILKLKIIKPKSSEEGEGTWRTTLFDDGMARAFGAMSRIYTTTDFKGLKSVEKWKQVVDKVRAELPWLSEIINDPVEKTVKSERVRRRPKIQAKGGYENDPGMPDQIPKGRVVMINSIALKEVEGYDVEKIRSLRDKLNPNSVESDLKRLGMPEFVAQAVLFIALAAKDKVSLFRLEDSASSHELHTALTICLRYFEKYPELKNLAHLVRAWEKKLGLNRDKVNKSWQNEED